MRGLKTWAWAAVLTAVSATPAAAQQGGITSGGGGGGLGLGGGSSIGGLTSSGLAGGLNSGTIGAPSSGIGAGGLAGGMNRGTGGLGGTGTGGLGGQQGYTGTGARGGASGGLQASNLFSSYYANPMALGLSPTGQISATNNGRFGQALFTSTGGTTGARGGIGGATGFGGRGGAGGLNSASQSGIIVPIPVQINYAASLRFTPPPLPPTRLQSEIRGILDNSTIANPKTVQIIADANNNIILRGKVKDEDEARLIEGMVRLTPGVRGILNELAFPVASK